MRLTTRSVHVKLCPQTVSQPSKQSKRHGKAALPSLGGCTRQPALCPNYWLKSRAEETHLYQEGSETLKPICRKHNSLNLFKHQSYPRMCGSSNTQGKKMWRIRAFCGFVFNISSAEESSMAVMCINKIKGERNIFHIGLTPAQWENITLK